MIKTFFMTFIGFVDINFAKYNFTLGQDRKKLFSLTWQLRNYFTTFKLCTTQNMVTVTRDVSIILLIQCDIVN